MIKSRPKLNLSIDIIMLSLMLPIAGIGFLTKYVLIPGSERAVKYGSNTDLEFWGLARHDWGTIHMIVGIVFLALLGLHIVLHWQLIVCIFRKMIPNKLIRAACAITLTGVGLLMISFPLFIEPEVIKKEPLHQNRRNSTVQIPLSDALSPVASQVHQADNPVTSSDSLSDNGKDQEHALAEEYEVNGSCTLQYVSDKYNVPVAVIASDLNIPEGLADERLGRLRKRYSFTMDDVRNSISGYKKLEKPIQ